jgi:uncharacterized RDD family membrane protein YckC
MAAPPAAPTSGVSRYGGIATRAVALAIDVALAHVIVFALAAVLALVGSLAGENSLNTLEKILAGCLWALVVATYFVMFWSTAGQTPGMRAMGLRVLDASDRHPGVVRSMVRLAGLVLAIIPFGAGFLPVLFDDRRRALPDFMAKTVVVYEVAPVVPAA